jgi:hypothetical protein
MALDVFHQVLARLLEVAGGNPRQMVPIVDVLRQEKLFGSVDMIQAKLEAEGWIAVAPKKDHVFVTTWGIEELRKTAAPVSAAKTAPATPAAAKAPEPKNAAALRDAAAKARDLAAVLEELATGAGGTGAQRKARAKKALAAASAAVEGAFE